MALQWLRADLAARSHLPGDAQDSERRQLLQVLDHWKVDPELARLREPAALAGLAEPDRSPWLAFWREVDALVASLKTSVDGARPAAEPEIPEVVRGFLDPAR
jgi:hypothetical protein